MTGMKFCIMFQTPCMKDEELKQPTLVKIDYNDDAISPGVKDLQPLIYTDGKNFKVVESAAVTGVLSGYGPSIEEAFADFQARYEEAKQNSI